MAMHVDHASVGSGAFNFVHLEAPEPDFAPLAPEPESAASAVDSPTPPPAPGHWVPDLAPTVFEPLAPHPGEVPAANALATLDPPPAVAVI